MLAWLACLLCGICLWALARWLAEPWRTLGSGTNVDRPAINGLRVLWPWILALSPLASSCISWRRRRRLEARLQRAGLPHPWTPEHFVALRWVAGLCVLLPGVGLLWWTDSLTQGMPMVLLCSTATTSSLVPVLWVRGLVLERQRYMLEAFPFLLDMTTLCVEAGLNLHGALKESVAHGPPGPLRDELAHALTDIRTGAARGEALAAFARRTGLAAVTQWVAALEQADQLGMSLGPLLRAQSEQRRNERFLRAEKKALEAPVKMLFPLVVCIFPCTFLVLGFPIAIKFMGGDFL